MIILILAILVSTFIFCGTVSADTPTIGQALDNTGLYWITNGTVPVNVENYTTHDGVDAVGLLTTSFGSISTAQLQTIVNGPGTIKFYWTKSYIVMDQGSTWVDASSTGLFLFQDNNKTIYTLKRFDNNSVWSQKSYTFGPGKHVLSWYVFCLCPYNNYAASVAYWHWNSMNGYVDQVQWIPAPEVTSTSPKNGARRVSRTSSVAVKLSEKILKGVNWSKIVVKNKYGKAISISKSISGNTLYIKTSKRGSYSYYTVYIPAKAVKDYAGNNLAAGYTFKFKTGRY